MLLAPHSLCPRCERMCHGWRTQGNVERVTTLIILPFVDIYAFLAEFPPKSRGGFIHRNFTRHLFTLLLYYAVRGPDKERKEANNETNMYYESGFHASRWPLQRTDTPERQPPLVLSYAYTCVLQENPVPQHRRRTRCLTMSTNHKYSLVAFFVVFCLSFSRAPPPFVVTKGIFHVFMSGRGTPL